MGLAHTQHSPSITVVAGAAGVIAGLLFILSDMVLAAETFVLKLDHPARRVTPYVIWGTYWGAQVGFFSTFA